MTKLFINFMLALSLSTLSMSAQLNADELRDLVSAKPTSDNTITTDETIGLNDGAKDKKILSRINEIFQQLDGLKLIEPKVNKGVVTLKGQIHSTRNENTALKLAGQIDGVVAVENELTVTRNVEQSIESVWSKVSKIGQQLLAVLPLLIISLIVFVVFWLFGRWLSHRQSLFLTVAPNNFIANLFGQVLHFIFIVIGLILALSILDATSLLGTILGAAGIVGLAIGFAVKDTVENYIASILLSLRNPFEANDFVSIEGQEGSVARLTTRATILISPDGNHIRIPNAIVFKAVIINFTRNPERRFDFEIGVASDQNLQDAQQLALDTIGSIDGVLAEPKPMILIDALGDFNVVLQVYGWVDQTHYSFVKVQSEAIRRLKRAFDQANIVMPEPIYQIKMSSEPELTTTSSKETIKEQVVTNDTLSNDIDDASADILSDNSIENKVTQEYLEGNNENLLSSEAPKE